MTGRDFHPLGSYLDFQGLSAFLLSYRARLSWRTVNPGEPGRYPDGLAKVLAASETDKNRIVKEFLDSNPNEYVRKQINRAVNGLRNSRPIEQSGQHGPTSAQATLAPPAPASA